MYRQMPSESAAPSHSSQCGEALRFRTVARDEGEREAEPQRDREQLLGIEREAEEAPRNVKNPADDAGEQQSLQDVGAERRGARDRRRGCWSRLAHSSGFAWMLCSLKYFSAPG